MPPNPHEALHACISQKLKPLKARMPGVVALSKSFPFHAPMLAALLPELGER